MKLLRHILCTIFLLALCTDSPGSELHEPRALKPAFNDTRLDLTGHIEILLGADADAKLDDIQQSPNFIAFNPNALEPWTSTSYWVRFRIDHSNSQLEHWYLAQDYEHIRKIELYYPSPQAYTKILSGSDYPLSTREFPLRTPIFKIPIHEKTATYYMRVSGMPMMQLRLSWNSIHSLVKNTAVSQLLFGLFFGGLLIIFFFNAILYLAVRSTLYLYYVYYLGATIISFLYENGFSNLFNIGRHFDYLFVAASFFGLHGWFLFFRNFFKLKQYASNLNIILHVFQHLALTCAFGSLTFFSVELALQILAGFILIISPFVFTSAAIRCWQKDLTAGLYLLGWLVLVPLLMFSVLKTLSISSDIFTRYMVQFGTLWETLLFTLALSAHIGSIRASRDEALRDTEQNRRLNKSTLDILETERKSIAQEIHDGFNATLITIKVHLETVRRLNKDPAVSEVIEGLIDVASSRYESARKLVRRLRPEIIDTMGLQGAIEELVDSLNRARTPCEFACKFEGDTTKLDEASAISLYRIAQEATTNILKHADARRAEITLAVNGAVNLSIQDNGVGFDKTKSSEGVGLVSIRERVIALQGKFNVHTSPGTGTCLNIQFPTNAGKS